MQHNNKIIDQFFDKKTQEKFSALILSKNVLDPFFSHIENLFHSSQAVMQLLHDNCMISRKTKNNELSNDVIRGRILFNLEIRLADDWCVREISREAQKNLITSSKTLDVLMPVFRPDNCMDDFIALYERLMMHFDKEDEERYKRTTKLINGFLEKIIEKIFIKQKNKVENYSKILIQIENSLNYEKNHFAIDTHIKNFFHDDQNTPALQRKYIRHYFIHNIAFRLSKTVEHAYLEKVNMNEYEKKITSFLVNNVLDYFIAEISEFANKDEKIMQVIYDYVVNNKAIRISIPNEKIEIEGRMFSGLQVTIDKNIYPELLKIQLDDTILESLFLDKQYGKLIIKHFHQVYKNKPIEESSLNSFVEKQVLFLEKIIDQSLTAIDLEMKQVSLNQVIRKMEIKSKENSWEIQDKLKKYFIHSMAVYLGDMIDDFCNLTEYKNRILGSIDEKKIRDFIIRSKMLEQLTLHIMNFSSNNDKIMQIIYDNKVHKNKTAYPDEFISIEGNLFCDLVIKINDLVYTESFASSDILVLCRELLQSKQKSSSDEKIIISDNQPSFLFFNKQFEELLVTQVYEKFIMLNNNKEYKNRISEDELVILVLEKILSGNFSEFDGLHRTKINPLSDLMDKIKLETTEDNATAKKQLEKFLIRSMAVYIAANIKNIYREKVLNTALEPHTPRNKMKKRPTLFSLPIEKIQRIEVPESLSDRTSAGSHSDRSFSILDSFTSSSDRNLSPPKSLERGSHSSSSTSPGTLRRSRSSHHIHRNSPVTASTSTTSTTSTSSVTLTVSENFTSSDSACSYIARRK